MAQRLRLCCRCNAEICKRRGAKDCWWFIKRAIIKVNVRYVAPLRLLSPNNPLRLRVFACNVLSAYATATFSRTNCSLNSHNLRASAASWARAEVLAGFFRTKYNPLTPSTSGDEAR